MMKYFCFPLAVALMSGSSMAIADEHVMDQPMTATTLRFADRYISAFYTVDKDDYNIVIAYAAGSQEGEQLIRQTVQLKDGQSYRLSFGGYGGNEQASTISMTRTKDRILASVVTCDTKEQMARCR
jgi:hypothetical protein